MRRYLFSASSAFRVENCPVSTVLPSLKESSEASEKGNDNHARIEASLVHRQATGKWLDDTPPELMALVPDDATILGIELALAWDTATGTARKIGERISRNYGDIGPTEIPGTVDLVFAHDGKLYVIDWKSRTRVTSARRNRQIHIQALACADLFGASDVMAGLVYLDNWEQDIVPFDLFELDNIATEVAAIMTAATNVEPTQQPHLGPWCEYCPAQVECPSQKTVIVAAASLIQKQGIDINLLSDENKGVLHERLGKLIDLAKQAKKYIGDLAKKRPIPLPDGKVLAGIEKSKTSMDQDKAKALLEREGIPVPMKTSTWVEARAITRKTAEAKELEAT